MVVYNYKRIPSNIYANLPAEFCAGTSDKGWMTAMLFYEYIANTFWPWIVKMKYKLPVILFVDGHVSHLTQPLSEFCHTHDIVLAVLPPNATHFMQPLDVSMFSPLKSHWRKHVNLYRIEKEVLSVAKHDFAALLQTVFNKMDLKRIMANGFRTCGLHPFSVKNVDFSKIFNRAIESQETFETPEMTASNAAALKCIETNIEGSKLDKFRRCLTTNQWMGEMEDMNLFHLWRNIYNNCHGSGTDIENTTNNDTQMEYLVDPTSMESEFNQGGDDFQMMDILQRMQLQHEIIQIGVPREVSMANIATQSEPSDIEAIFTIDDKGNVQFHENFNSFEHAHHVLNTSNTTNNEKTEICATRIAKGKPKILQDIQLCSATGNTVMPSQERNGKENCASKDGIPLQFKNFIFWPNENVSTRNKRGNKVKPPSVLTSEEGLRWYKEKEEKKEKIEKEKQLRKLIRAAKSAVKKETQKKKQGRGNIQQSPLPSNL